MLERISQLIRSKKLTASQFADEVGVQPSSVSHVLSGRNKPSLDFVTKIILAYPDVDPEWLLTGKGSMFSGDVEAADRPAVAGGGQTTMELGETLSSSGGARKSANIREEDPAPTRTATAGKRVAGEQKKADRIVIFYADGTFRAYSPAE